MSNYNSYRKNKWVTQKGEKSSVYRNKMNQKGKNHLFFITTWLPSVLK